MYTTAKLLQLLSDAPVESVIDICSPLLMLGASNPVTTNSYGVFGPIKVVPDTRFYLLQNPPGILSLWEFLLIMWGSGCFLNP